MNSTNKVLKGSFGPVSSVTDFLPPPSALILKKQPKTTKITLTIDESSLIFFKQQAKKLGGSYQRMMRNLLNEYVSHFGQR